MMGFLKLSQLSSLGTAMALLLGSSAPAWAQQFAPFATPAAQSVIQVGSSLSSLCLVDGASSGTPLVSQSCVAGGAGQTFNLVSLGTGYYNVVGVVSGLCVDAQNVPEVVGASVIQRTCASGIRSQEWMINQNADYSFNLVSYDKMHSLSALSTAGALTIASYAPGSSEQEFTAAIPSFYASMPVQSVIQSQSGAFCMTDSGQGSPIGQQSCVAGGAGQQFSFQTTGDGYFNIVGVSSGLCLDATEYLSGVLLENVCMSGVQSQKWGLVVNLNTSYTLTSYLGAYSLASQASAGPVSIVAAVPNATSQEFKISLPAYFAHPRIFTGGPALAQNCPEDAAVLNRSTGNGFNSNLSCVQSLLGYEAIQDGSFLQGFNLGTPVQGSSAIVGTLTLPSNPNATPVWTLGQTDSHESLEPSNLTPTTDGSVLWQDPYKSVQVMPGSYVELGMNGIAEWNNVPPPAQLSGWPHLLLAQGFMTPPPGAIAPPASEQAQNFAMPPISHISNIYFSMTAQLRSFVMGAPGSTNPLHTPIFVTVSNLNPLNNIQGAGLGYGQGILMNISGYDSNDSCQPPMTNGIYIGISGGAGDQTYSTGFGFWSPIAYDTYHPITYSGDIAPAIKNGLQNAMSLGDLTSTNFDDYYVQDITAGWEAPLNANGTIRFSDMSLRVFDSYNPMPFEFNTSGDLQGWSMTVNGSNVAPNLGNTGGAYFNIPASTSQALFTSPTLDINASRVNRVSVNAVYSASHASALPLTLSWQTTNSSGFSSSQSVTLAPTNTWGNYTFDMSQNPQWTGTINQLQLSLGASAGGLLGIGHVRFSRDPVLNYVTSTQSYTVGTAVGPATLNAPTRASSAFLSYEVSPELPAGLSLNPTTGSISGTPTTASAAASYTITGSSPEGSASTTLRITVNK
jgi:hypothetical protein